MQVKSISESWSGEMVPRVKAYVEKSGTLSAIPGTYMVRKNWLFQAVQPSCKHSIMLTHVHNTIINVIKIYCKKF